MAERLKPTVAHERRRCLNLVQAYRAKLENAARVYAGLEKMLPAQLVAEKVAASLERIEREIQDPTPPEARTEFSMEDVEKAYKIMEEMNKNPFEE